MSETSTGTELEVPQKKELEVAQEQTRQGRYFSPLTDIYETDDALVVIMEIPGVNKSQVDVKLEKDQLTVDARVGLDHYGNLKPTYTEYNIGHFSRGFTLSNVIDRENIQATVDDGVLTLNLPKIKEATPRVIPIE